MKVIISGIIFLNYWYVIVIIIIIIRHISVIINI